MHSARRLLDAAAGPAGRVGQVAWLVKADRAAIDRVAAEDASATLLGLTLTGAPGDETRLFRDPETATASAVEWLRDEIAAIRSGTRDEEPDELNPD